MRCWQQQQDGDERAGHGRQPVRTGRDAAGERVTFIDNRSDRRDAGRIIIAISRRAQDVRFSAANDDRHEQEVHRHDQDGYR